MKYKYTFGEADGPFRCEHIAFGSKCGADYG